MPHKRAILFGSLFGGVLLTSAAAFVWSHRLASERQERERHFIAIHFLAAEAAMEEARIPRTLTGCCVHRVGGLLLLLAPFPTGFSTGGTEARSLSKNPRRGGSRCSGPTGCLARIEAGRAGSRRVCPPRNSLNSRCRRVDMNRAPTHRPPGLRREAGEHGPGGVRTHDQRIMSPLL